jgi:hypothetical protein
LFRCHTFVTRGYYEFALCCIWLALKATWTCRHRNICLNRHQHNYVWNILGNIYDHYFGICYRFVVAQGTEISKNEEISHCGPLIH